MLCFLNGGDLLCNHRQNLDVNAIELIEAGPGSSAVIVQVEDNIHQMDKTEINSKQRNR